MGEVACKILDSSKKWFQAFQFYSPPFVAANLFTQCFHRPERQQALCFVFLMEITPKTQTDFDQVQSADYKRSPILFGDERPPPRGGHKRGHRVSTVHDPRAEAFAPRR